jgi:hypothetical protein
MPSGINGRKFEELQTSCLYQVIDKVPFLYPAATGVAATTVAGHANANTWGNWVTIIPAATIDASPGTHFDVANISIINVNANSTLYYEIQYNSTTIGRGFMYNRGTGTNLVRGSDFKMVGTFKVAGQKLEMRIMSSDAGESVDIPVIMWCSGTP